MEKLFALPCIPYLLFLLSFFSTIQELLDSVPVKTGRFHATEFSVKDIFSDNHNWDSYYYFHKREIRPIEQKEVKKMLCCKSPDRGCFVYHCPKCEEYHSILLGGNSQLCSDCGKRYTDQWAKSLSSKMFEIDEENQKAHKTWYISIYNKVFGGTHQKQKKIGKLLYTCDKSIV